MSLYDFYEHTTEDKTLLKLNEKIFEQRNSRRNRTSTQWTKKKREITLKEAIDVGYTLQFDKEGVGIIEAPYFNCEYLFVPDSIDGIDVVYVGDFAFNCCGFKNIKLPKNLKEIKSSAFVNCSKLGCVTLPNKVKRIYAAAFQQCISLKSVFIPDSVSYIHHKAFFDCENLTIYGHKESCANEYAQRNNIPFKEVEEHDI